MIQHSSSAATTRKASHPAPQPHRSQKKREKEEKGKTRWRWWWWGNTTKSRRAKGSTLSCCAKLGATENDSKASTTTATTRTRSDTTQPSSHARVDTQTHTCAAVRQKQINIKHRQNAAAAFSRCLSERHRASNGGPSSKPCRTPAAPLRNNTSVPPIPMFVCSSLHLWLALPHRTQTYTNSLSSFNFLRLFLLSLLLLPPLPFFFVKTKKKASLFFSSSFFSAFLMASLLLFLIFYSAGPLDLSEDPPLFLASVSGSSFSLLLLDSDRH